MNEEIKSWELQRLEKEIKEIELYNNFMTNFRHKQDDCNYEMFEKPKTKQIFNILNFMSL